MVDISSREYFSIILSRKLIAFRYSHMKNVCVCVYYHVSAVWGLVCLSLLNLRRKLYLNAGISTKVI